MATINQEKVFERVANEVRKGNKVSVSKEMRGIYSKDYAKQPTRLTRSDGWQELCEKYGLTDKLILTSLVYDIKKKPKNRKPELELAARLKGRLSGDEKEKNIFNTLIIADSQRARIARRAIARLSGSEATSDRLSDSDECDL